MRNLQEIRQDRQVAVWLMTGVVMIMIQVLLGGITRLTESGLSITEWNPITGTLPPLSEAAWLTEFEKYRHTDQFRFVHSHFSLSEFKFIFFWEWFHRLWARMMGLVFLVGFIYFLYKKKMDKTMVWPMALLFVLGGLQGTVGWIMVKSGLVPEMYFVGHVELTTHFMSAMVLLVYTFWFALRLWVKEENKIRDHSIQSFLWVLLLLCFFQFIYGCFMAGLKAAQSAPTWPRINGQWVPALSDEKLKVHFIHRGLGYLIFLVNVVLFFRSAHLSPHRLLAKMRYTLAGLITIQVILGIATLWFATNNGAFVVLGVLHQFNAMLVLLALVFMLYLVRGTKGHASPA